MFSKSEEELIRMATLIAIDGIMERLATLLMSPTIELDEIAPVSPYPVTSQWTNTLRSSQTIGINHEQI